MKFDLSHSGPVREAPGTHDAAVRACKHGKSETVQRALDTTLAVVEAAVRPATHLQGATAYVTVSGDFDEVGVGGLQIGISIGLPPQSDEVAQ
jgi:hypothetical protein